MSDDLFKTWTDTLEDNDAVPAILIGVGTNGGIIVCTRPGKTQEEVEHLLKLTIDAMNNPINSDGVS